MMIVLCIQLKVYNVTVSNEVLGDPRW